MTTEPVSRPCAYCWQPSDPEDTEAQPEGGFAPPHAGCLASVDAYVADGVPALKTDGKETS